MTVERRVGEMGAVSKAAFIGLAALAAATAATSAQAQYGPYTCATGLVWREAVAYDYICVSPQWRTKTQQENALGPSRRQPGGGPYGPDTCKQGFVWRETKPSDHVCVPPLSRDQNRRGTANGYTGYAHPDQLPSNFTQSFWTSDGQLVVRPANLSFYSWEPGRGYHGGFGNYGNVYGDRAVTPRNCRRSNDRSMYVLAVNEVEGVVSNAGSVSVPLCLYP